MSDDETLYWHCLHCGAHDPVDPTGDSVHYTLGDLEPCIECGTGTAHVVTIKVGAAYEQGRALGMSVAGAWERAKRWLPRENLTEALARYGLRHERVVCPRTGLAARRILDASGAVVLDGADVVAGWELVRELEKKQGGGE